LGNKFDNQAAHKNRCNQNAYEEQGAVHVR
jgi:hypothetical protein